MKTKNFLSICLLSVLTLGSAAVLSTVSSKNSVFGENESLKTYYQKTFTDLPVEEGFVSDGLIYGSSDGFSGLKLVDQGFSGYFVKEIKASSDMVFNSLNIKFTDSRLAYYFGDFGNEVEILISQDGTNFESVGLKRGGATAITEFEFNLNNAVEGKKYTTLYIKTLIGTTVDLMGFDTTWIYLNTVKIEGSEVSSSIEPSKDHNHSVSDYWGGNGTSQGTSLPDNNNAFNVSGLGGDGNKDWGALVGTWGPTVSASEGQKADIIYKIGYKDQIIKSATLKGEFKYWNGDDDAIHNGDRILVSVSKDNLNYDVIAHYSHNPVGGEITHSYNDPITPLEIDISLNDYLETNNRLGTLYVKITMEHRLAISSRELAYWGMFIHKSGVDYVGTDAKVITYDCDGWVLPEGTKTHFLETDEVYTLPVLVGRTNFEFKGWFNDDVQVTSFNPAVDSSISLKAKWEKAESARIITYIGAEGCVNENPETFDINSTVIIILKDVNKVGYTFIGWFDADIEGNRVTQIDPKVTKNDVILYARFEVKTFKITYKVDDEISITCNNQIPSTIKYDEDLEFYVEVLATYDIAYIKVNGVIITLDENSCFKISGNNAIDYEIVAKSVSLYNTIKELHASFENETYGDYSFLSEVFDYSNARIVSDTVEGRGLSIASEDNQAILIYHFAADEGKTYNGVSIDGLARLFDINLGKAGYETNLKIYMSIDGENYSLIKLFAAQNLDDGNEKVSLGYYKELTDESSEYYVKFELNGASNCDWAVIKNLSVEFTEESPKPILLSIEAKEAKNEFIVGDNFETTGLSVIAYYSDESRKDVTSTAKIDSSKVDLTKAGTYVVTVTYEEVSTTYNVTVKEKTPEPVPEKKGCGGSIIAASIVASSFTLLGAALIISKRKNK